MSDSFDLFINAGVVIDESFWFVDQEVAGIFCLDLSTGKTHYKCNLNTISERGSSFSTVLNYESKLILIPFLNDCVVCYDIDDNKIDRLPIEIKKTCENKTWEIGGGVVYKDKLLLYPGVGDLFYYYDLKTGKTKISTAFEREHRINKEKKGYFFGSMSHYTVDNYVYIPLSYEGLIVRIDMQDFSIDEIRISNDNIEMECIAINDDKVLIATSSDNQIFEYSLHESKRLKKIALPTEFKRKQWRSFLQFEKYVDGLYLIPLYGNMFIKVSEEIGDAFAFSLGEEMDRYLDYSIKSDEPFICFACQNDNRLFLSFCDEPGLFVYDNKKLVKYRTFSDKKCVTGKIEKRSITNESRKYNLDRFLTALCEA